MFNFESFIRSHIESFDKFGTTVKSPKIHDSYLSTADYQINIDQLSNANMATLFIDHLTKNEDLISKVSVAQTENEKGNKFINFTINEQCLIELLQKFNSNPDFHFASTYAPKKIIVDYSSPNLSKDMHVGHLRSTIIGDCLSNLFEYVGHSVMRQNHIGDFGLPFGIIVEYVISSKIEITDEISLQSIYVLAKTMFDNDLEVAEKAYVRTQLLQSKTDILTNETWNKIYTKSLASYQQIYKLLNISNSLFVRGESWYEPFIDCVKTLLLDRDLINVIDGRTIVDTGNANPMTFIKSESKGNAYTYDTTDIVALFHRFNVEKCDEIYYVVDQGQSAHFNQLFTLGNSMGWTEGKKVKHVSFGTIQGTDKKRIKSRDGNTPKLIDLVNDAIDATKKVYMEKHSDINIDTITKIAIGSLKYFDLSINRSTTYVFEFNKMLKFSGNTYTYASYALVRCNSIFAKLKDFNCDDLVIDASLMTPSDFSMLRRISYFPHVINKAIDELCPHFLCNQLYDLVDAFHSNYESQRCIDFSDGIIHSVNSTRIILYKFVKHAILFCFDMLGVPTVDRI